MSPKPAHPHQYVGRREHLRAVVRYPRSLFFVLGVREPRPDSGSCLNDDAHAGIDERRDDRRDECNPPLIAALLGIDADDHQSVTMLSLERGGSETSLRVHRGIRPSLDPRGPLSEAAQLVRLEKEEVVLR